MHADGSGDWDSELKPDEFTITELISTINFNKSRSAALDRTVTMRKYHSRFPISIQ